MITTMVSPLLTCMLTCVLMFYNRLVVRNDMADKSHSTHFHLRSRHPLGFWFILLHVFYHSWVVIIYFYNCEQNDKGQPANLLIDNMQGHIARRLAPYFIKLTVNNVEWRVSVSSWRHDGYHCLFSPAGSSWTRSGEGKPLKYGNCGNFLTPHVTSDSWPHLSI